ncbi:MAG TPA: FAD-dependent oxidoreductase [Burkholderiales bacterium]|nr:FAD-dependent oxidoreductase [Burkholderiales bacterium]
MVQDVIIVGGGLAGLACAVALGDAGLRVTVVERENCLGGRARSWTDAQSGDTIDLGPHVVHSEYRNMLAFLERLGSRDLICWQPEKLIMFSSGMVLRHRRLPPPLSLLPDLVTGSGLSLRDLWSNNRATWRAMRFHESDVPALDAVSALDYLRSAGVSARMIEWFWSFAALSIMNVPLERCSAAALLRVHSQLIGHRRLHFGFPALGLGELFAPQAANAVERAGGRILLGTEVVAIEKDVCLRDGTRLPADHVVAAVAPQDLAKLGREAPAVEACPYISSYLWFDRKLTGERFWAQLGALKRVNTDFYDLSNIRRGWSERPSVIASNIIYSHRAQARSDAEIVAVTQREIAEFIPEAARGRVVHAAVNRIAMAIPCPLPGSESERPPPGASLAGDWTGTGLPCSMESAVRSGWMAAEEVLLAAGRPRKLALPVRPGDGLVGLVQRFSRRRAAPGRAWRTPPMARPRPHP